MIKRFKIYDKETWDTHIEDTEDCYSDGSPKSYYFGENEDFCDLFDKLNELSEENKQLKYASDFMDQLEKLFQKYGFETVNLHVIETLFKEHLKK